MRTLHQWLDLYGESHQNRTNKTIHWICVPVIYWTVFAILWEIPAGPLAAVASWLNWAVVVAGIATAYYFALSWKIGLGMLLINVGLYYFTAWLDASAAWPLWQIAVVAFVLAWIGQFIGHHIEGKKPSFFTDLQFLLIGPIWLLNDAYQRVGIRA